MDIQSLVDASMEALMMHDTEAIKEILRQGLNLDYIFPSKTDGRVHVSAGCLFRRVNGTLPGNFIDGNFYWCRPSFDMVLGDVLLHVAAYFPDLELINLLLEKGADVTSLNKYRESALHIACVKAPLEIIHFLVEKSPKYLLNLDDHFGHTPLDSACEHNCPEVVEYLISQGSSLGAQDISRYPLIKAILHNNAEYSTKIASLLLDAGASVNCGDDISVTPLLLAISKYQVQSDLVAFTKCEKSAIVNLCILLIDHGCDVNAEDDGGNTALHLAVASDLEDVVRKLLISGSDINRCNKFGNTPLYYACENGNRKLVDLLIISGTKLRALDWETTLRQWRRWGILDEKNTHLLNYIISESKKCLDLENLCYISIRKNIRNLESDAIHLSLPPSLVRRLQFQQ